MNGMCTLPSEASIVSTLFKNFYLGIFGYVWVYGGLNSTTLTVFDSYNFGTLAWTSSLSTYIHQDLR